MEHFRFGGYKRDGLEADAVKALSVQVDDGASLDLTAFTVATQKIDAITIDLATGNTVIPSEAVDMDKATDAITNDTWTLTRSADGVTKKNVIDYFNQFDEATIRNSLSIDDMIRVKNSGGKYTVTGKAGCNSYLDVNGDPVLILEVNHALGDYVEVQF